jgi:ComF family protein
LRIKPVRPPYCQICGRPIREGGLCRICKKFGRAFAKNRSVGIYDGVLADAVKSLKYRSRMSVAKRLGRMMAAVALADPEMKDADVIVPVPMHRVRLRERGFNQALLLSLEIANEMDRAVLEGCLLRTRYTKQQARLARKRRRGNVTGAFKVLDANSIRGRRILLVDDVTTTGATLEECAACLREAGAAAVYCLTAAIALA